MDFHKKPVSKWADRLHKGSWFLSILSMLFTVLLFLRMEAMNRKADMIDHRVGKVENDLKMAPFPPTEQEDEKDVLNDMHNNKLAVPDHHAKRTRRSDQQLNRTSLSLEGIRKEIDKKFTQACSGTGKICIVGPSGPPGSPGAPGYPGYKGEKGAPGKTGSHGPVGPAGPQGQRGEIGSVGGQGLKGDRGQNGPTGQKGAKGSRGITGPPGVKGPFGSKGAKGVPGSMGRQGQKGKCVARPSVMIFPESLAVFINESATFYCWVQGQVSSAKVTLSRLGSTVPINSSVGNEAVLHFRNVQQSHPGRYVCNVQTAFGSVRAISTLTIKEKPAFTIQPLQHVSAYPGSTVKLCCSVSGSPRPTVKWSKIGGSLHNSLQVLQQSGECLTIEAMPRREAASYVCRATNLFGFVQSTTQVHLIGIQSCDESQKVTGINMKDGPYLLKNGSEVYCDMTTDRRGWTLIARFSNSDNKTWINNYGYWWYGLQVAMGTPTNPSVNADMISPAFWLVSGREFKITRSDDSSHTPLLQTTENCLGGQAIRSKFRSYFGNGKVWSSDKCLGSCTVQYGGQYKSTDGFQQAECSSDIQSANKIGFLCHWGDYGSVMMIGGGGGGCSRADHGIGIAKTTDKKGSSYTDFGYDANTNNAPSTSYSLNLWIR